ncbi:MAG: lipoprotein-releasing ABC transporter permease subunit [Magnetococcus sp. DMHC-6]
MIGNRYEWAIALRYLKARRTPHFISVITFLSMGGIALGVAALIVVLAVMTGFREELQKQILGVTSHVVVQSYSGHVDGYPEVIKKITKIKGVEGAAPFVLGQAMLMGARGSAGVVVRGILPDLEKNVAALASNVIRGSLDRMSGYGIVVGRGLAQTLGVDLGSQLTVMVPVGNVTAAGTLPRMKRFTVVALFNSGMFEYDNSLAYIDLADAQTLLRLGEGVTGIKVRTPHPDDAFGVRQRIEMVLDGTFWIRDWIQMNHNFFQALNLEKTTMSIILFLVVLVAAFNIVSSLIMVVMEKGRDIAILKTMGATSAGIMAIFIMNGGVIGVMGTLAGLLLGLTLALNLEAALGWVEHILGIRILSGDVYYIDHVPSVVKEMDVVWIVVISLAISLLATLYPAWRAASVDPVETLRYE